MKISIKYFGVLAEITGCHEEQLSCRADRVSDVLEILLNKYPELKSNDFRVAQNKLVVNTDREVDGTEIAFLPPFSGG